MTPNFATFLLLLFWAGGSTSSYMRMLNSSLLGNEKLCGPVVRNVGGVSVNHFLKHSNHLKRTLKMF